MSKLFKSPSPPQEDPAIAALRKQEQERAEADRTRSIQDQLGLETRFRNRLGGMRSLLGSLGGQRVRSLLGAG